MVRIADIGEVHVEPRQCCNGRCNPCLAQRIDALDPEVAGHKRATATVEASMTTNIDLAGF